MTPLIPPFGLSISPFLLEIYERGNEKIVCPASSPVFIPILKAVIVSSVNFNSVF